jgi:hypothetical protein
MNHAAVSADQRRPFIVVAGITLLAMSIASFLIVSSEPAQSFSLLLAYAGGMAMLLTP